jgi:hypothetical protein
MLSTLLPVPVLDVTPVPPFVTAKVPASVIAPVVAVEGVKPVLPPLKLFTNPVPELMAFETNAVVAICVVLVPAEAVGAIGVPVNVGPDARTTLPVPVVDALEAAVARP